MDLEGAAAEAEVEAIGWVGKGTFVRPLTFEVDVEVETLEVGGSDVGVEALVLVLGLVGRESLVAREAGGAGGGMNMRLAAIGTAGLTGSGRRLVETTGADGVVYRSV